MNFTWYWHAELCLTGLQIGVGAEDSTGGFLIQSAFQAWGAQTGQPGLGRDFDVPDDLGSSDLSGNMALDVIRIAFNERGDHI